MAAKPKCETCGATDSDLWVVKGKPFCYPGCYEPARDWCDAVAARAAGLDPATGLPFPEED